jgi:hypothetical protein
LNSNTPLRPSRPLREAFSFLPKFNEVAVFDHVEVAQNQRDDMLCPPQC